MIKFFGVLSWMQKKVNYIPYWGVSFVYRLGYICDVLSNFHWPDMWTKCQVISL